GHLALAVPDARGGAATAHPDRDRRVGGRAQIAAARGTADTGQVGRGRRRVRAGPAVPPADPGHAATAAGGADPRGRAEHSARSGRAGTAGRAGRPGAGERPRRPPGAGGTRVATPARRENREREHDGRERDDGSGGGAVTPVEAWGRTEAANRMENIVGDRVLIALQPINISRLSTHVVPIVPGTLIVVAGAGPKDSNGAGKSSFIAAITALLGDEQWRFASGAKA